MTNIAEQFSVSTLKTKQNQFWKDVKSSLEVSITYRQSIISIILYGELQISRNGMSPGMH